MVERARILLIEDTHTVRNFMEIVLSGCGHEIVKTAETYSQAIDSIGKIASGELVVDVITYDGQLQDPEQTGKSIYDVVQEAKRHQVQAWGIGMSSFKMSFFGVEIDPVNGPVHMDLGKENLAKLGQVISQLDR